MPTVYFLRYVFAMGLTTASFHGCPRATSEYPFVFSKAIRLQKTLRDFPALFDNKKLLAVFVVILHT
jgi:hypothetical protein